jgi:hypothetical protein
MVDHSSSDPVHCVTHKQLERVSDIAQGGLMNSLGKGIVAVVALVVGLVIIMKITMPDDAGPSQAQIKAHSRTTEGIEATCGRPDRTWSDHGALGGVLTYAYDQKGAQVHFLLLEGRPPVAVTVSRGKKTYKIDAPETEQILPCVMQ